MKGNVIVGQSGGPTSAINSSLAGVYRTAMTLSFMALPVIPELKLTARGLFNVNTFSFVGVEAD